LFVLGLVGATAFAAFSIAADDGPWRSIGQIASAVFVGWTVIRPAFQALQARRWLASGTRAKATVIDVAFTPARDAGASIEALRNGTAVGRWRVDDGLGHDHVIGFTTDAPWAALLQPGSMVDVLSEDDRTWELGLVDVHE
jgi:hypothetical protein